MLFLLGLALAAASTAPTTAMPTGSPTPPTTTAPSMVPTTAVPTSTPTSAAPNTVVPSTQPTSSPSVAPTSSWQNIPLETLEANLTCGLPSASYRQFDKMSPPLCIVIDDKSYLVFYPQVDEFTLLEVQDSFNSTWLDNPQGAPVYVRAEVGKRSSYWRARSQGTGASKLTVPFWTLVIELADGQVTSLTWDDSCSLCATSDLCVDDLNCGVEHTSCGQSADANNCNLQIYIAWFGTDVDGKYLTSSDKRLSRFRSGSLRGAYDSALKKANNIAEIANPLGTFTGR